MKTTLKQIALAFSILLASAGILLAGTTKAEAVNSWVYVRGSMAITIDDSSQEKERVQPGWTRILNASGRRVWIDPHSCVKLRKDLALNPPTECNNTGSGYWKGIGYALRWDLSRWRY